MEKKKMSLSNMIILTIVFSVLVVAFQVVGTLTIELESFAIALAIIPICIGAFYGGPYVGAILGGVFAISVLFIPSTWSFLRVDPFATIVVVLAKGILAGFLTGLAFSFLTRVNKLFASVVSAAICPLVNTFIFLGGSIVFFTDNLPALTNGRYSGLSLASRWFWSISADNFIFEFALSIMVSALAYLTIESIRFYKRKKYLKNKRHSHHRRPHYPNTNSNEGK